MTPLQHIHIVITLQQQGITAAQLLLDVGRPTTNIGQHPETTDTITEYKLGGFPGIMRHWIRH